MIVMREIMNAKQTQVHPCNPSQGSLTWTRRRRGGARRRLPVGRRWKCARLAYQRKVCKNR